MNPTKQKKTSLSPSEIFSQEIGYLCYRTGTRSRNIINRYFKKAGYKVTPEQLAILGQLAERQGMTQQEIADQTYKDSPGVTRMLDHLEKLKMIERRNHESDRRSFRIHITPLGVKTAKHLLKLGYDHSEKYYAKFTQTERKEFIRLLNKLWDEYTEVE